MYHFFSKYLIWLDLWNVPNLGKGRIYESKLVVLKFCVWWNFFLLKNRTLSAKSTRKKSLFRGRQTTEEIVQLYFSTTVFSISRNRFLKSNCDVFHERNEIENTQRDFKSPISSIELNFLTIICVEIFAKLNLVSNSKTLVAGLCFI